jgi:hypothetical protein
MREIDVLDTPTRLPPQLAPDICIENDQLSHSHT